MTNFKNYRDHTGSTSEKFYKTTLFRSHHLLIGLNCVEPGQTQAVHSHEGQDKYYFVIEGQGEFVVGGETQTTGPGMVVWAPADVAHGVTNKGEGRLVIFMGIAPAPIPTSQTSR